MENSRIGPDLKLLNEPLTEVSENLAVTQSKYRATIGLAEGITITKN